MKNYSNFIAIYFFMKMNEKVNALRESYNILHLQCLGLFAENK